MVEATRPSEVTEVGSEILPASLVLFSGLKRAYESKWASDLFCKPFEYDFTEIYGYQRSKQ